MGYGGKVVERARARELRAQSRTLDEIARELGVSKSSVSVWVRDVEFTPTPATAVTAPNGPTRCTSPNSPRSNAAVSRLRH